MNAYRTFSKVGQTGKVILKNVPFNSGDAVEVLLLARRDRPGTSALKLRKLFKDTQVLPQSKKITEETIRTEIAAYRRGK